MSQADICYYKVLLESSEMTSNFTCEYTPQRIEGRVSYRYLSSFFHSNIIHDSQKEEATKSSIDEWVDNQNVSYT